MTAAKTNLISTRINIKICNYRIKVLKTLRRREYHNITQPCIPSELEIATTELIFS